MKNQTRVTFTTSDELLQKLVDTAEKKSLENLKWFGPRQVLIEGGGYEKIWLETQPMGGEMYAKRNVEAGINNQLLFLENQREDGRFPGSVACIDGKIVPQFNKFQGFCFPSSALNMYYIIGKDAAYLDLLYTALERFDGYLWRVRDSDGDGCLETWCKYDTGEDHALRYGDAPDDWSPDVPPEDCHVVPMASMDIMSYSYSCRETLQKISRIQGSLRREEFWKNQAVLVREKIRSYLWDESAGACFDRDKNHRVMRIMTHNNLRAMYWNSFTPSMADRFVREHLLNPEEFWTNMPLPSVAVNDPMFKNVTTNDWSGQVEALTYQRAIRALENYGYDCLIPKLGEKLFHAIGERCVFVQQYDPFTSVPSYICLDGEQDGYGPALLSVMEYAARMYGIHIEQDRVFWGISGGREGVYEQVWGERAYKILYRKDRAEGYVDGRRIFETNAGVKIITDTGGKLLGVKKLSEDGDIRTVRMCGRERG